MRFNAHLLQSRGGVADIGVGNEAGYSDGTITKGAVYYVGTGAKTSDGTVLASETRYRRIYVDQIYCSKYNGSSYGFASFFNGTGIAVKQHELMTAGQMSDYITNATEGVIPKWLGDHKNTTQTYDLGTVVAPASPSDWRGYDFNRKIYSILNRLFKQSGSDIPAIIPDIYVTNVHATNLEGAVTASDVTATNLSAGRTPSGTNYTFKVFGGATGDKHIEIVRGQNGAAPIGIHGTFHSSDTLAGYEAGTYSFMDVGRYYLRDINELGKMSFIGKTYIQGENGVGASFNFSDLSRKIILRYPSEDDAHILTTRPTSSAQLEINLHDFPGDSEFDFLLQARSEYSGLSISRVDAGPSYEKFFRISIKDGGNLMFTDDNFKPIYLQQSSGTIYNASDLHILRSEAGEIIYGPESASTYNEIIRFRSGSNSNRRVTIGYKGETSSQSRFYITQYNSAADIICAVPFLFNNSEFIVSYPTSAQTINKEINITSSGRTIAINPFATVGSGITPTQTCQISSSAGEWFRLDSDSGVCMAANNSSYIKAVRAPTVADQGVLIKTNGLAEVDAYSSYQTIHASGHHQIAGCTQFKTDHREVAIKKSISYYDSVTNCTSRDSLIAKTFYHAFKFTPTGHDSNMVMPAYMFGSLTVGSVWYVEFFVFNTSNASWARYFAHLPVTSTATSWGVANNSFGTYGAPVGTYWNITMLSDGFYIDPPTGTPGIKHYITIKATLLTES